MAAVVTEVIERPNEAPTLLYYKSGMPNANVKGIMEKLFYDSLDAVERMQAQRKRARERVLHKSLCGWRAAVALCGRSRGRGAAPAAAVRAPPAARQCVARGSTVAATSVWAMVLEEPSSTSGRVLC